MCITVILVSQLYPGYHRKKTSDTQEGSAHLLQEPDTIQIPASYRITAVQDHIGVNIFRANTRGLIPVASTSLFIKQSFK